MNKKWLRIVISVMVGGIIAESIHLFTNGKTRMNSILIAILLYFALTFISNSINGSKRKANTRKQEDVIDDI